MQTFIFDDTGLKLTEQFEGLRLTSYQDVRGIWTIGYGHTGHDVVPGLTITQAQAEALLRSDIAAAAACVASAVTYAVNQHQFDALVDFTFNVGRTNFVTSTLLKKLNAGDIQGAADEFMRWDKSGGRVFDGLVRRRTGERALFLQAL
jgi:lysozyme